MDKKIERYLSNLPVEKLLNSPLGNEFRKAMVIFEKVQQHIHAVSEKKDGDKSTIVKAATVMTFSILNKFVSGKHFSEFKDEDWREVVKDISEYAILQEEQKYVQFIFKMYERYIRFSAEQIESVATEDTINSIRALADELEKKTECLEMEAIDEVNYIESCLWICLEAMIKLIASMVSLVPDEDFSAFAQALSAYAFEYGCFIMYNREQEIINEYIQSQYALDKELEEKYSVFIKELELQAEQFFTLIDNAFVPDFRERFLNSIVLAQTVGVDTIEILTDIEGIDAFFM